MRDHLTFGPDYAPSPLERVARILLFACVLVALLSLVCCQATPAQAADTAAKVTGAFAAAAALWLNSLQASGAITPEQAAEFGTIVGQAQSTIDMFAAAAKATAQAVGQLRTELTQVKAKSWTNEEIAAGGAVTAALAAAAVQKMRGPSATTEERVRRAQARKG